MHGAGAPSRWVQRWQHLLTPGTSVLDVACGQGRHVRWLAQHGCRVTGVDRDAAAVEALKPLAEILVADIEGSPWPLAGRRFDVVLTTNYLWRPLLPTLRDSVAEGGLLIVETFADGQQAIGRPTRPDFLLQRGELLQWCAGWQVVAFEDGIDAAPERHVQRIVAARPPQPPGRFRLDGGPAPGG